MAIASDIGWGKYREFEGPFYRGKHPYLLPVGANDDDKVMMVITATEGGRYDAYNGYDVCICTSGLIQWCERGQYSVSDMLGKVAEASPRLLAPLEPVLKDSGYVFRKNKKMRWRFFKGPITNELGEVDTTQEQRELFLLRSNGKTGTWDDYSKAYAKKWAAAISTVWENREAQQIQITYTTQRLNGFALPYARTVLDARPDSDVGRAFRAAYLSFAANNPTWANKHLQVATKVSKAAPWTRDWLIDILKELTFGPNVVIYPHRYKAIRPVLEKLYGVDLPDFAEDLKKWQGAQTHKFFFDTKEIQQALLFLGYDLGPAGADGIYGNKTREAVLLFEQHNYGEKNKVPPEHVDGMVDEWTARKLEEVVELRGIEILSPT